MTALTLAVTAESWPLKGSFAISRGAKREAAVVVATLSDGTHAGRGECVPYAHYGETVEGVCEAVRAMGPALAEGLDRLALQERMPPGAARNALDCALWDYEAKARGARVEALAALPHPEPLLTAFTIGLGAPDEMAAKAAAAAAHRLLKLKLGSDGDAERLRAVRRARPDARLIVDANEGWRGDLLAELLAACAEAGVELVEQPLPAGDDAALAGIARDIPVCADESAHDRSGLADLAGRYDAINIKLDKTGGLTEALALAEAARAQGLKIMVGCMVGTSLSMAPAIHVAQGADVVDLDGPLLLARDRDPGLAYTGDMVAPPSPELWG